MSDWHMGPHGKWAIYNNKLLLLLLTQMREWNKFYDSLVYINHAVLQKEAVKLLEDDRFASMFKDANFQVDTESEEYRLLNPLVTKLDKQKEKKNMKKKLREAEVRTPNESF